MIGVIKAYTTRVGEGPFPTELKDEIGRLMGKEAELILRKPGDLPEKDLVPFRDISRRQSLSFSSWAYSSKE